MIIRKSNGLNERSVSGFDEDPASNSSKETIIGEMDWRSAHTMLHEQAIYQHDGAQYQVEKLDYDNRKAFVRLVEPDYYTDAMTHTRVSVIQEDALDSIYTPDRAHHLSVGSGEVSVVEKVVGFKKIKYHTHENVGFGEVHLPEMQMHTTAIWFTFPSALIDEQVAPRPQVIDALRGAGNAMHTVAAISLMTDRRDLGHTVGEGGDDATPAQKAVGQGALFDPTIFIYDHIPGGVGLAERIYEQREVLLQRTFLLISGCSCDEGCPACIGPPTDSFVPDSAGSDLGGPDSAEMQPSAHNRKEMVLDLLLRIGAAPQ